MRSDFYNTLSSLPEDAIAFWQRFRQLLRQAVQPTIDEHWLNGTFPHHVIKPIGRFLETEFGDQEYVFPPADSLRFRLMKLEMGRIDPSMASFVAVHFGLTMGSIASFGSAEQKQKWLPPMLRMDKIGSWALTEPYAGSDVASGLRCTATQTADGWVVNGQKKWAGNASMADVIVVWASIPGTRRMVGFLVEPQMAGVKIDKIHDKIAKRAMENVIITLENVHLQEHHRLPNIDKFKQLNTQLTHGRVAVAWEALGIAMGAFEAALAYTDTRKQFGKPISGFQLIQEKLVNMLEEITCMQTLLCQLHNNEMASGELTGPQASLAKRACCRRARKVCSWAREVMGGNGILLEYGVARLFADMEAVYSYEGTDEINTLIVGRQLTGQSAFV